MERLIKRYTIFDLYDLIDTTEVCLSEDVEKLEKHLREINKQLRKIIDQIKAQTKKG